MAKRRTTNVQASIILEIQQIVEDSISDLSEEVEELRQKLENIDKLDIVITNGVQKHYTMSINNAINNIYVEIGELKKIQQELKDSVDDIKENMPETTETVVKKLADKSDMIAKIAKGIIWIILLIGALFGYIKLTNIKF